MRKSLAIYLAGMTAVVLLAGAFSVLGKTGRIYRYHQHLRQPSEEALGACEVCGKTASLCTHLPIISVETGGKTIPGTPILGEDGTTVGYETSENGESEIVVKLSTVEKEGVWHHPEDEPSVTCAALFRIRGNSSRYFSKKNYKIELVSEEDPLTKEECPLLGMSADSEWALHGPFLDKTLMRNYMWMNLAGEIMGYAPNVRFCELMLDGEYQGVYLLMEMIREGAGRVELTEYDERDLAFSYIVHLEPQKHPEEKNSASRTLENFSFYTHRLEENVQMELLYPGLSNQTDAVKEYVTEDLSFIEHYLYSREMEKDPDSCWDYLDLASFANYYIIQEYLGITDLFSASTYFYKDVRGKLHIGPVWDFNNVWNNFFTELPADELLLTEKGWYQQLMKSGRFVNYVIARYHSLRKGILSEESVEEYVDAVQQWLGSAVDRNFQVWGYSFDSGRLSERERRRPSLTSGDLTLEEMNPSSYREAVEQMLDFARTRGAWMDRNIDTLRQYCHSSRNANERFD